MDVNDGTNWLLVGGGLATAGLLAAAGLGYAAKREDDWISRWYPDGTGRYNAAKEDPWTGIAPKVGVVAAVLSAVAAGVYITHSLQSSAAPKPATAQLGAAATPLPPPKTGTLPTTSSIYPNPDGSGTSFSTLQPGTQVTFVQQGQNAGGHQWVQVAAKTPGGTLTGYVWDDIVTWNPTPAPATPTAAIQQAAQAVQATQAVAPAVQPAAPAPAAPAPNPTAAIAQAAQSLAGSSGAAGGSPLGGIASALGGALGGGQGGQGALGGAGSALGGLLGGGGSGDGSGGIGGLASGLGGLFGGG